MQDMFARFFGEGVWAVLEAVLILILAFVAAAIVKSLTVKLLTRTKLQALLGKRDPANCEKVADFIGKLLHLIVFLLFVPGIFERLGMSGVSSPILGLLNTMWGYLPNILAALIILVIGCMVAKLAGNIAERLIGAAGLDARLSRQLDGKGEKFALSKIAGGTVHVVLVIFFLVESFGVLHLDVLTKIGNAIIGYLPSVLAAVLILLACYIGNAMAQKALLKSGHRGFSLGCQIAVYGLGGFMILSELGIAQELVNTVFVLAAAALAVAFALSFGIGGREFAGRMLKKAEDGISKEHHKP